MDGENEWENEKLPIEGTMVLLGEEQLREGKSRWEKVKVAAYWKGV
jgi:hypothetical protein